MAKIYDYKLLEKKVYIQEECISCGDKECYPVASFEEVRHVADMAEAGEAKVVFEDNDKIIIQPDEGLLCFICDEKTSK